MKILFLPALCLIAVSAASAQISDDGTAAAKPAEAPAAAAQKESRIFGIIPNNRSISLHGDKYEPLSVREKFKLATSNSFDPGAFAVTGILAGIGQWSNQYPSFGQGTAGYGKRYGMMFLDNMSTAYMTEGIVPSIFHQDPRYFRLGEGSTAKRVRYSLSRLWMARCDNGKTCFNYGEIVGNSAQAVMSNYYYPAAERKGGNVGARAVIAIGPDAASNLLREFWPDISRRMHRHSVAKPHHN